MEIAAKNKAYLRGLGVSLKPSLNLGKEAIDASFIKALDLALEAHELVKIRVLQNSESDVEEVIRSLENKTHCGFVAMTGKMILFYRPNYKKDPHIVLPK